MTNFKLHTKQVNQDFCSVYLALYSLGEYGIEVGYKIPDSGIANMNKELMDWQLDSDCCALCNTSTLSQSFTISSYAILNPNPCPPLIPLFAGRQFCPCFVNQSLNQLSNGSCCNQ